MYIKKVNIANIRSIKAFEMVFPAGQEAGWHVLLGDNGSGKSTIVRAIALGLIGASEARALRLPFADWIRHGEQAAEISLSIQRDTDLDGYARQARPLKRPIAITTHLRQEETVPPTAQLASNGYDFDPNEYIWSGKQGWFSASFGPFRRFTGGDKEWSKVYYSSPRAAAHLSVFGEDVALTESLDWLLKLKFSSFESNMEATNVLNSIKTFINEGGLMPHGVRLHEVTSAGVIFKDPAGINIDVTQLSDGFRSLLSMIFELVRQMVRTYGEQKVFQNIVNGIYDIPLPGVVIIDEIDAHLHPTWQDRIGQWFTKYFPNLQFIVTTHSPLICRGCADQSGNIKGTIWRLAVPASQDESGLLSDTDRDRLIFGNVSDAYSTGAFGQNTARSSINKNPKKRRSRNPTSWLPPQFK
jgi:energy-coupling factor transporter ATP-binding protein EcfA2